jgi:hypothetical protein
MAKILYPASSYPWYAILAPSGDQVGFVAAQGVGEAGVFPAAVGVHHK